MQLYTVMTDSHRTLDNRKLARVRDASRAMGFWTADQPDKVWAMDRDTADEIVANLGLNAPRVVRLEKALAIIEEQARTARDARACNAPA